MEQRLRKGQKELRDPGIAFRYSDIPVLLGSLLSMFSERPHAGWETFPSKRALHSLCHVYLFLAVWSGVSLPQLCAQREDREPGKEADWMMWPRTAPCDKKGGDQEEAKMSQALEVSPV